MEETNDTDIYADLPKFRYFDGLDKLQATNKSLNQEIIQLNETLAKLTKEKDEYQTKCATLAKNISSLLKTAQAEIQRKDRLIKELRDQITDSAKQNQSRKRKFPEKETNHSKIINNGKDFLVERCKSANETKLNKSSDDISKEDRNITTENKDSSASSNKTRTGLIPDAKCNATNNSFSMNAEINAAPKVNVILPPGGCKTLYSQRMFNKIHGLPVTNRSQEVVQIESRVSQSLTETNNANRSGSLNTRNTKVPGVEGSKQPEDKKSLCTPTTVLGIDSSNSPLITSTNTHTNNCLHNGNKSVSDTNLLVIENEMTKSKNLIIGNSPINGTQYTEYPTNIALDKINKTLKALPLLELPSVDNNFGSHKKPNGSELRSRNCENDLFFRGVQSNQQNSHSKTQNLEESTKLLSIKDTKIDSPKFLRPISSTVIKKPFKKIILPVSNCWNGLIKTVDNVKERKEGERLCTVETISTPSLVKSDASSFNEDGNKQKEQDTAEQDKLTTGKSITSNVLEDLFGSPLKWAENSNETTPLLELNSPTVYEDSCSAHIENAKFNFSSMKPTVQKPAAMIINNHLSGKNNASDYKTDHESENQNELPLMEKGIVLLNMNKSVRAFEEVGGNKQKVKSIFSPLKNDSCKSSTSGLNLNTISSADLTLHFQFKSKYEDSVLGQFDDTTQFVSALTKVESKISPLNTPVKSVPKVVTVNTTNPTVNSITSEQKTFSQAYQKLDCHEITTKLSATPNNKNFNEKPINILYPRKTPRIVTYNKTREDKSNEKQPSAVNDTPTKCNRFAINDAFISQQEEKVKRICKSNFNDPIAITICAKNKPKGKESSTHQSPQGKGLLAFSPRKSKLSPSCLKKRGTVLESPKSQKKHPNDLNAVGLSGSSSDKPLRNHISSSSSPRKIMERTMERAVVEKPVQKMESVRETECNGITRIQNLNNNIDSEIENVKMKSTCNDFTTHSVLDRRKSVDSGENVEKPNNYKDSYPHKSCTSNINIDRNDYTKKGNESLFGKNSSENLEGTVVNENVTRDASKECTHLEVEDPVHNNISNLNIKRNCDRLRIQNFKPSSHFKKTNKHSLQYKKEECERIVRNNPLPLQELSRTVNSGKELETCNYNVSSPDKWKSNERTVNRGLNGNINQDHQCFTPLKDPRKSPNIIIRSSKKPEFVSTTLSDDDFTSRTLIKSPDINCRTLNKGVKEWVLKPITFDSHHKLYKKQKEIDNQKEVPRCDKHDSNTKSSMDSKTVARSNKHMLPVNNTSNNMSCSSSNKKVILARRPLNFGVRVTLD